MIPQASRRAVLLAVAGAAEDMHQLSYNHFEQNKSHSFTVDAAPDDTIAVDILDTCPSQFSFEVKGIEGPQSRTGHGRWRGVPRPRRR